MWLGEGLAGRRVTVESNCRSSKCARQQPRLARQGPSIICLYDRPRHCGVNNCDVDTPPLLDALHLACTWTPVNGQRMSITGTGVDLTGILGGGHGGIYYKSPAVEAKNTFSYIVMQEIWCLKFCNMTKSGGQSPQLQILGGLVPPCPRWSTPMIIGLVIQGEG